jgi:hypothetical protein
MLAPTFSLTIGNLNASTDNPVLGPRRILIERDMDIPADAARLQLMERSSVFEQDECAVTAAHFGDLRGSNCG